MCCKRPTTARPHGYGTVAAFSVDVQSGPVVAVGDLNADGAPDVLTVALGSTDLIVALGNGDGTLASPTTRNVGRFPVSVSLAEVNGDGALDALVVNQLNNTVEVYTGIGDGTFADIDAYGVGQSPTGLAVADVNGDGLPDLVTANEAGGDIRILLQE